MDIVVHQKRGLVNITLTKEELALAVMGLGLYLRTDPPEKSPTWEMLGQLIQSFGELEKS